MLNDQGITRRRFCALTAGLAMTTATRAASANQNTPPVVVELFTSQGCSSCPPADVYLNQLRRRKDVLALSFNVDYWDYLGWHDTLGSPDFTRRQRDYAAYRGDGQVYTPQMVIDGRNHIVGSNRTAVEKAITAAKAQITKGYVPMTMRESGKELVIDLGVAPDADLRKEATLWVMTVTPEVKVKIERGENAGRTITYHNVVRRIMPAGMWHGEKSRLTLPRHELYADGQSLCVALLQIDGSGPVIGVATHKAG